MVYERYHNRLLKGCDFGAPFFVRLKTFFDDISVQFQPFHFKLRRHAPFWRVFPWRSYAEQNPWLRVPTNVVLITRVMLTKFEPKRLKRYWDIIKKTFLNAQERERQNHSLVINPAIQWWFFDNDNHIMLIHSRASYCGPKWCHRISILPYQVYKLHKLQYKSTYYELLNTTVMTDEC